MGYGYRGRLIHLMLILILILMLIAIRGDSVGRLNQDKNYLTFLAPPKENKTSKWTAIDLKDLFNLPNAVFKSIGWHSSKTFPHTSSTGTGIERQRMERSLGWDADKPTSTCTFCGWQWAPLCAASWHLQCGNSISGSASGSCNCHCNCSPATLPHPWTREDATANK